MFFNIALKSSPTLYVILPYFNFVGYASRRRLFIEFVNRISNINNIKIIISEVVSGDKSKDLPAIMKGVYKRLKVSSYDEVWLKENLINLAVKDCLPSNWKYMAWIDADITFVNDKWAHDTIEMLKIYDVVQMFQTAIYLGPEGQFEKADKGFAYMHCASGKPYVPTHKYGYPHPGFAWACTKNAYDTMEGLIDWSILGSGDNHMALSLIKKSEYSYPRGIHINYKKLVKEFENKCSSLKLGYVNGTILHHWHGSLVNRKYRERWNILVEEQYDPTKDIFKDESGAIRLTSYGKRLIAPIRAYFMGRQEDLPQ